MTWSGRQSNRVAFMRGLAAQIVAADGTWRRSCTVIDISKTGAKLMVEGSTTGINLREFFLQLSANGHVYRRCGLIASTAMRSASALMLRYRVAEQGLACMLIDAMPSECATEFSLGLNALQLVASRTIAFLDSEQLEDRNGREALFRDKDGSFVLYLSAGDGFGAEERLVRLTARNAILWVNERADAIGSFWA